MNPHHEYVFAVQLSREYDTIVHMTDTAISLLKGEFPDGQPAKLNNQDLTLEQKKEFVGKNLGKSAEKLGKKKLC